MRHIAELRPQLADTPAVVVGRLPRADSQCLLEQRVHVGGPVQVDPQFRDDGSITLPPG
jgi:hypothetical protein